MMNCIKGDCIVCIIDMDIVIYGWFVDIYLNFMCFNWCKYFFFFG